MHVLYRIYIQYSQTSSIASPLVPQLPAMNINLLYIILYCLLMCILVRSYCTIIRTDSVSVIVLQYWINFVTLITYRIKMS